MKKKVPNERSELSTDKLLYNDKKMSVLDHLSEIKQRFIHILLFFTLFFCINFRYADIIYIKLALPLIRNHNVTLIATGLTENFFLQIKIATYMAILFIFPVIIFHIYRFMAPGLYQHEKKLLLFTLVLSPILFIAGCCIAYYAVMPIAWPFFLSFYNNESVGAPILLYAKITEYLDLVLEMSMAFGLAFQMPIILSILCKFKLLSINQLKKGRRYATVLIFIIAAILTPPDVISQILLAIPMLILYEASILMAKYIS